MRTKWQMNRVHIDFRGEDWKDKSKIKFERRWWPIAEYDYGLEYGRVYFFWIGKWYMLICGCGRKMDYFEKLR